MTLLQWPAGDSYTQHPEKREGFRGPGEARAESMSPCKARWEIQQRPPWHKALDSSQVTWSGERVWYLSERLTVLRQTTPAYPPFFHGS